MSEEKNKDTKQKKEQILSLVDRIEDPKTKTKLLKLLVSILIGAGEKTQQYFTEIQTEFKKDPAVKALIISIAYVFQMKQIFPEKTPKQEESKHEPTPGR